MSTGAALSASERSPRAYARYRELVEKSNQQPINLTVGFDLTNATNSWWQLPALEAKVFHIQPSLANALCWAFVRYQDANGETDLDFEEFRAEDRAAYPAYFKSERQHSMESCIGFMSEACNLPWTQTLAWVCRAQVQYLRDGLMECAVEAPPWAHGKPTISADSPYRYDEDFRFPDA